MSHTSWFPRLTNRPRRTVRHRRPLWLERLEDRVTPTIDPTTPFQLDGNAITQVTTPATHDWDQVFADAGSPTAVPSSGTFTAGAQSKAVAGGFSNDLVTSNMDDIFTGGGSKDTQGIQSGAWQFTASRPQPKDDIANAFAAAYNVAQPDGTTHLILYAGADRYSNNGDSTMGFWFFNNVIGEGKAGSNGTGPFTGTHEDGDLLLISDFTQGGSVSTPTLYEWVGNDATGHLQLISGVPSGDTIAIVNNSTTNLPWSFTDKTGTPNNGALPGEFIEEGVDLTALHLVGCFNSFLAETRSSQSPTATLSDFVLGRIDLCSVQGTNTLSLSKFDTFTGKGDLEQIDIGVINTGAVPMYLQSVTDTSGAQTLLGNLLAEQSNPVAPVESVTSTILHNGQSIGSAAQGSELDPGDEILFHVSRRVQQNDPDPTTGMVTFVLNDAPDGSGDNESANSQWAVNLFQPSAKLTETASPTTATQLGQVITYTFTLSNTSSSDSPNLILDPSNSNGFFTDTLFPSIESDAIAAAINAGYGANGVINLPSGASFSFTETRPIQAGDPNPLTDSASAGFTFADTTDFPNVIHAAASASVTLVPHLEISKAVTPGDPSTVQPGGTASFTITVTNDGAGPATNVVVTDQLPDASQLSWMASSSAFTSSINSSGLLTATDASLAAGTSASITVSAVVPLNFFGTSGGGTGTGNNDPVPLNLFELDGNVTKGDLTSGEVPPPTPPQGSTTPSHDWDQVYADNTVNPKTNTAAAIASNFVNDPINTTGDDIFTGGGSKDPNPISQWQFKNGKPQGKDDIENAFAALYKDPSTSDQILYAGLTRFDNSGDATAGFWFFVNPISENANGTFSGTHSDGDILLVSDFTIGGSESTIKVFEWSSVPVNGSNLVLLNNGNLPSGSTFAIVNGAPISVPWSYLNKSSANKPDHGEFLEEGINLTGLGLNGCFSSFLAETRSSQSPTATLSDLVLGNFSTCDVKLPNQASVQASNFNNGQPITSNMVVIDINDGDPPMTAMPLVSRAVTISPSISPRGLRDSALADQTSSAPALSGLALSLGSNNSSNGSNLSSWESAVLAVMEAERKLLDSAFTALDQTLMDWADQVLRDPLAIGTAGIMGI